METVHRSMVLCVHILVICSFTLATTGHWSSWGEFSPCSVTCGFGTMKSERVWIFGPNDATTNEPYTETQEITCIHDVYAVCPQHGFWSEWIGWSFCTSMCGGGLRERQRQCRDPMYGGRPCEGKSAEEEECKTEPCPPLPKHFDITLCKEDFNFTCASQKMCVPFHQRCDTEVQCHDGSDEADCLNFIHRRGGNVRYRFSMWGNGVLSKFRNSLVDVLIPTFITIILLH